MIHFQAIRALEVVHCVEPGDCRLNQLRMRSCEPQQKERHCVASLEIDDQPKKGDTNRSVIKRGDQSSDWDRTARESVQKTTSVRTDNGWCTVSCWMSAPYVRQTKRGEVLELSRCRSDAAGRTNEGSHNHDCDSWGSKRWTLQKPAPLK